MDIAAAHEDLGVFLYFNGGSAEFGEGLEIAGLDAVPYSMASGDLPEIVLGLIQSPGWLFWNGDNGRSSRREAFGDGQGGVYGIAIGDLDVDGFADVATA